MSKPSRRREVNQPVTAIPAKSTARGISPEARSVSPANSTASTLSLACVVPSPSSGNPAQRLGSIPNGFVPF